MATPSQPKPSTADAFEAFGQQFLAQFGPLPSSRKRKANESLAGPSKKKRKEQSPLIEEKNEAIYTKESSASSNSDADSIDEDEEIDESDDEDEIHNISQVPVVVFDSGKTTKLSSHSKSGFMSSKISKVRGTESTQMTPAARQKAKAEEEEDRQNDKTLFKLIHTKLLSASLDEHSNMSGAKRKKSIEGRVLELATAAKLGKGETTVRKQEHNKAPRHIREGIVDKRRERNQAKLEEAKDAGNYHPMIKRLLVDPEQPKKRVKRDRGIGMGVGKFRGGVLNLGKQDLLKAQGPQVRTDSKRGKGRRPKQGRSG